MELSDKQSDKQARNNFDVQTPILSKQAVETLMRTHWPKVFAKGVFVPLQRKIHKTLIPLAASLGVSSEQVKEFLAEHCTSIKYRKCIAAGGPRLTPSGEVKGNVSSAEKKQALDALES